MPDPTAEKSFQRSPLLEAYREMEFDPREEAFFPRQSFGQTADERRIANLERRVAELEYQDAMRNKTSVILGVDGRRLPLIAAHPKSHEYLVEFFAWETISAPRDLSTR